MHQRKSVIVAGGVSPTQSLYVRLLGVIRAPRAAFDAVVQSPRSAAVLIVTFLAAMLSTGMLLETEVGRLALVDHWERTATAFGLAIDDQDYAEMEDASQNGLLYAAVSALVSGPLLTIALAAICVVGFGGPRRTATTYRQALAVVAHASVILAIRQIIAAPIAYARETLASLVTMGSFFPMLDETSLAARFLGLLDLFVLWWIIVLAIGASVLYRRPVRRLALVFVGVYVSLAVILAAIMAAEGTT